MALRWVMQHLAYRTASRIGAALGVSVYRVGLRRAVTLDNLRHAFPEKPDRELRAIAEGAFANYGTSLVLLLWSSGQSMEEVMSKVRVPNPAVISHACPRGTGCILLSGHFGAWEMMGLTIGLHVGKPLTIIVQTQRNRLVDAVVDADRRRFGNATVTMGVSVREIIEVLRRGDFVAMLGDQSGPKEAAMVTFFGRPCAAHRGAARFSLKYGIPIVFMTTIRQPDGTYVIDLEEVDRTGLSGSLEEQTDQLTQRHTSVLERHVRAHPDHWLWMHKRWKHSAYFESRLADQQAHPTEARA